MRWEDILDIVGGLILLGMFLAGLYEVLAIINLRIPFTHNIPLITDIVRPLIARNKNLSLGIVALAFAAQFWLFFHFFLDL